jgi:hypothetical protein
MKYAFEVGLDAIIYVREKFHKDWFRHSKVWVMGTVYTYTQTAR